MWCHAYHSTGSKSRKNLVTGLESLSLVPGMRRCLIDLQTKLGAEIVICSDSNTFYIAHVLRAKCLEQFVTEVIANKATFNVS